MPSAEDTGLPANDGGTLSFENFEAMGWYWNGELHPLKGFHLVRYEDGCVGIEKDA